MLARVRVHVQCAHNTHAYVRVRERVSCEYTRCECGVILIYVMRCFVSFFFCCAFFFFFFTIAAFFLALVPCVLLSDALLHFIAPFQREYNWLFLPFPFFLFFLCSSSHGIYFFIRVQVAEWRYRFGCEWTMAFALIIS